MRGRSAAVALTLVLTALVAGACSSSPSTSASSTTSTSTPPDHHDDGGRQRGGGELVGAPSAVAPGAVLTAVSCPVPRQLPHGHVQGADLPARLHQGDAPSAPPCPPPHPRASRTSRARRPPSAPAAPSLNQVALYNGTSWGAPATIAAAQGFTAVDCTGPSFCITIDGEGNSFAYDGSSWSGNIGAWGAANQISCVSPTFCVAAEGGPSVFNGSTWTQPGDADSQGSAQCGLLPHDHLLRAGRQQRRRPDLERDGLLGPPAHRHRTGGHRAPTPRASPACPARRPPSAGPSTPTGASSASNGTTWSPGVTIDKGHGLTAISCPTTTYCVAVDRAGNAFISG